MTAWWLCFHCKTTVDYRLQTEAEPEMVSFLSVNRIDEAIDWRRSGTTRGMQTLSVCVSCSVMSDSLQPHGLHNTRLLCPWDFPSKDPGVGCYFLLQGIFPTQGSNPGLLHCRQILYRLSCKGSPTGIHQKKKKPRVQRQRRRCKEMVEGVQSW